MNYHHIYENDMVNGTGVRVTVFLSGCIHACEGCYNENTWNPKSGIPFTKDTEDRVIELLKDTKINRKGLSLSGGDPLHPRNLKGVNQLIHRVRTETTKDIWLWSGFTLEELNQERLEIVRQCDVFIDGKFVKELADPCLQWRGSSNQRIITKEIIKCLKN